MKIEIRDLNHGLTKHKDYVFIVHKDGKELFSEKCYPNKHLAIKASKNPFILSRANETNHTFF